MSNSIPTTRQIAWISLIPHIVILGALVVLWHFLMKEKAVIYAALCYLFISMSLRTVIPQSHRKGIQFVRKGDFKNAIVAFEKSYAFFTKNNWIDKYRYITVLSSSKMSYREMALTNIAFCYGQMGEGENAKKYFEIALNEFPDSYLAQAGLNFIKSMDSVKS